MWFGIKVFKCIIPDDYSTGVLIGGFLLIYYENNAFGRSTFADHGAPLDEHVNNIEIRVGTAERLGIFFYGVT